ncbi:hypothetical protein B566_EDAN013454 [Ephemera danica]|nr:hypothetical protein B566_EDAN013454 [Ephemera danica]
MKTRKDTLNGRESNTLLQKEMADAFNKYFRDTTEELIEGALPEKDDFNIADLLQANQNSNFEFTEISSDDILKIIKSLPNRFIAGPDEIPNSISQVFYYHVNVNGMFKEVEEVQAVGLFLLFSERCPSVCVALYPTMMAVVG